jgi:hypothetical protein
VRRLGGAIFGRQPSTEVVRYGGVSAAVIRKNSPATGLEVGRRGWTGAPVKAIIASDPGHRVTASPQRGIVVTASTANIGPFRKYVWNLGRDSIDGWMRHQVARTGAALAFYTVFSLGPVLILSIAILPDGSTWRFRRMALSKTMRVERRFPPQMRALAVRLRSGTFVACRRHGSTGPNASLGALNRLNWLDIVGQWPAAIPSRG